MKKFLLLFVLIPYLGNSFGQSLNYKKGNALGVNFFFTDFKTASEIRSNGLESVLKAHNLFKTSRMDAGLAVDYMSGLSNHVDFISSVGGVFVDYPNSNIVSSGGTGFLMEATACLNLKLLSDRYWVTPFIDLGVGASNYNKYFGAFIPMGAGLQVNIANQAFLLINSQYRIPVTENVSYHFYHSIGIAGTISKKKVPAMKTVEIPIVADRDSDGLADSVDRCPDLAGIAALQGCPDKDADGIADADDECPGIPGLVRYRGCPIPDTDSDGINDEEDKCPDVKGVARYQGCPVPDTDGDGVTDEEDKCPTEAGSASNQGCPVIDTVVVEKVNNAAQNIFFATGSDQLLPASYPSLQAVVQILKENPSYQIDVNGYTDITGNADKNQVLSENRAQSVKEYLVINGVDAERITSTGHGIHDPVADNKTTEGRAKNRRVEMKLRNY